MSQIKDGGLAGGAAEDGLAGIDARIGALLGRRRRLLEELASVDAELSGLRSAMVRAVPADGPFPGARWFPLRGEQIGRRSFATPPGLDREDLARRLDKIMLDERSGGGHVDRLEVLVGFQPASGRVLAVRTRRTGEGAWQARFEAEVGS